VSGAEGAGSKRRRAWGGWKAVVGLLVSGVLLYFAFRNEDPRAIYQEIRGSNLPMLLAATVAATFVFWIRAWRWKSIVEPIYPDTKFRARFAAVNIGFMGNNLLPARLGEFLRAYALTRMEPVPLVASFGSLVVERLLDGIMVVSFLLVAVVLPDFPALARGGDLDLARIATPIAVFVVAGFAVLFGLVLYPVQSVALAERTIVRVLPRGARRHVVDGLIAFLSGLGVLRDPVRLARAFAWTVGLWLFGAFSFWLAFEAFRLDLPFTAAIFFQSAIALAVSVPSAPGFFGPWEAAAKFVLSDLWGIESARALGFAIGFHLAGFVPVTLMGLYYAWSIGLTTSEAKRSEQIVESVIEGVAESNPTLRPGLRSKPSPADDPAGTDER
jgi:glycosyltransferase 2 family protein